MIDMYVRIDEMENMQIFSQSWEINNIFQHTVGYHILGSVGSEGWRASSSTHVQSIVGDGVETASWEMLAHSIICCDFLAGC